MSSESIIRPDVNVHPLRRGLAVVRLERRALDSAAAADDPLVARVYADLASRLAELADRARWANPREARR